MPLYSSCVNGLISRSSLLIQRYGCVQLTGCKLLATRGKEASKTTKPVRTATKVAWSKDVQAKVKEIKMRKPHRFSAYTLFCVNNIPALKEAVKDKKGVNIIKENAAMWRALPSEKVQEFKKEAEFQGKQYVKNLVDFRNSLTEDEKRLLEAEAQHKMEKKMKMLEKASGKPKRPTNAFSIFLRLNSEKTKMTDLKEIADKWRSLPAKEKEKIQELYIKEKFKYETEMSKWIQSNMLKENYKVLTKAYVMNELYNVLNKPVKTPPEFLLFRTENSEKYKTSKELLEAYQLLSAKDKKKLSVKYGDLLPQEKRMLSKSQKAFLEEEEETHKLWRENMAKKGLMTFVQLAEKYLKKKSSS